MHYLRAIFVTPEMDGINGIVIDTICRVTNSPWAHVAIGFEDCIIEADFTGIRKTDAMAYEGTKTMQVFMIPVTDEQYEAMRREGERWVGARYGYDDCIVGGLVHVFGKETADKLFGSIDDPRTKNCSALYSHILRFAYPSFGVELEACEITPHIAYDLTVDLMNDLGR